MAEARKRRELLPLVYQHLLQAGYVRAARELKEQSGQKSFPIQPFTLSDIYTHWQLTSELGQKQKAEEDAALEAKKSRVSDPISSSESSEEEEEEAEAKSAKATPRPAPTTTVAVDSPSSQKAKAQAKAKKASQVLNSVLHPAAGKGVVHLLSGTSPTKPTEPSADMVLVSETEEEGSFRAHTAAAKPGMVSADQASSSGEDSSSSSDETDVEVKPSVKPAQVQTSPAPTKEPSRKTSPGRGKVQGGTPQVQGGPCLQTGGPWNQKRHLRVARRTENKAKTPAGTPSQVKTSEKVLQARPASVSAKGTPGKGTVTAPPGKTGPTATQAKAGKTKLAMESSSEESDSEEEAPAAVTTLQVKPSGKTPQVRATSASTKESPRKGTPSANPRQAEPSAAQAQVQDLDSSSDESDSDDEETPAAVTLTTSSSLVKKPLGQSPQVRPVSAVGVGPPRKDTGPTPPRKDTGSVPPRKAGAQVRKSEEDSESTSEDESDEEDVVPSAQAKPTGKSLPVRPALGPAKELLGKVAAQALPQKTGSMAPQMKAERSKEDSESSEESTDREEAAPTAMTPAQGRSVEKSLAPPGRTGPAAAQVRAEAQEDSESSEEESSSEEAAATPAEAKPLGKTPQTKANPSPTKVSLAKGAAMTPGRAAKHLPIQGKTPVRALQNNATISARGHVSMPATRKVGPTKAQKGALADAEKDSESSSEEQRPAQVRPLGKKTTQVKAASAPVKESPRKGTPSANPRQAEPSAAQAQVQDLDSSSDESDSDDEETPAAVTLTTSSSLVKKPLGQSPQVRPVSAVGVGPPRKDTGPTPPRKDTGSVPPRKAGAQVRKSEEDSESTSEDESDEEDVVPSAQAKPTGKSLPVRPALGPTKELLGKVAAQALPQKTGSMAPQMKAERSKEDSESSEESTDREEAAPTAMTPAQGRSVEKSLAPPGRTGPAAAQVRAEAQEDSESSEEESSSEEAAATPAEVKTSEKVLQARPASVSAKGTPGKGTVTAPPGKTGPTATQAKAGKTELAMESSSEESDSEEEAPAAVTTLQVKPSGKTPQVRATSASTKESPRKGTPSANPRQAEPSAAQAQVQDLDSSSDESDSDDEETPAAVTLTTSSSLVKKPLGQSPQVRPVSAVGVGLPRKDTGPIPPRKDTGPIPPRKDTGSVPPRKAGAQVRKSEEDSESTSEEESDDEDAVPSAQHGTPQASGSSVPAPASSEKNVERSSESSDEELPSCQVIKCPLVFVDPNCSPAGLATTPTQAQALGTPRKAQVSGSTAQSSSESEDVVPASQPSTPAVRSNVVSLCAAPPRATPQASRSEQSSQIPKGKEQKAAALQTSSAEGALPVTQSSSTPAQARANKLRKSKVPAERLPPSGHPKTPGSSDDEDSSDTSSGSEEDAKGPQNAKSASKLVGPAPSQRDSAVKETPSESSEDEVVAPSQSLLSGYVTPGLTLANSQASKATPRPNSNLLVSSAPTTKDYPDGKPETESQPTTGTMCPRAGRKKSTSRETPQKTQKPKKGAASSEAETQALHTSIAQHLLGQPWSEQMQASVVKVLTQLLEQERKKASEAVKESSKKDQAARKRKLLGDHPVVGAPKSKKKKHLVAGEGGECGASPEKASRTSKGKSKREKASDANKEKKGKGSASPRGAKNTAGGELGVVKVEGGEQSDSKSKKGKKKSSKKKKDKEKKKRKKTSAKDPDSPFQKKKKKKKMAEPTV